MTLEYYLDLYQERAAIYEYDALISRVDAEAKATNDILKQYIDDRNIDTQDFKYRQFVLKFIQKTRN
jgi:phosphoribosylaminoimidazole-succinocarboxamide synthase